MTPPDQPRPLIIGRVELIEALSRRTEMQRAQVGVPTTGLQEAAFILALDGFRVEMPGGAHFVWAIEGELPEEVIFDPKSVDRVLKVLISQAALAEKVEMSISPEHMSLGCGSARILIAKKRQRKTRV
ncbi:MAG: hypothetical protein ACK4GW_03805 [Pseudorhodobacter sp.]